MIMMAIDNGFQQIVIKCILANEMQFKKDISKHHINYIAIPQPPSLFSSHSYMYSSLSPIMLG